MPHVGFLQVQIDDILHMKFVKVISQVDELESSNLRDIAFSVMVSSLRSCLTCRDCLN
jgi:hypothetical protein